MGLTNKKKEEIAVNRIRECFVYCDTIDTNFNLNDKELSWDGDIKMTLKDGIRRVSVQIKGRTVKELPIHPSIPIRITDLQNYKRNGGVLFFVVFIIEKDKNREEFPYYVKIAPIDAKRYIKQANGKAQQSVRLQPVPTSPAELENIVLNFKIDCDKQTPYVDRDVIPVEEAIKKGCKVKVTQSKIHATEIPNGLNFQQPVYLYAEIANDAITTEYPIGDQAYYISEVKNKKIDVSINGETYFRNVTKWETTEGFDISIGEFMNFKKDSSTPKVKSIYRRDKSALLSKKIQELHFIQAMLKYKKISLGKQCLVANNTRGMNRKNIEKEIRYWERMQELFHKFNIYDEINIKELTKEDRGNIRLLIDTVLDKKPIMLAQDICPVATINIANYSFLLLVEKGRNGKYKISNFFDIEKDFVCKDEDGHKYITSPYTVVFKRTDFITYDNIKYEDVVPSYIKVSKYSEYIPRRANSDMLMALNAYDKSEVKNDKLYNVLLDLCEWTLQKASEEEYKYYIVNKYQIIKRKRNLTKTEKEELLKLLSSPNVEKDVMVAIHLLLDNKTNAEICFESLSEEEKESFLSMPISYFMK